tara:strand:+ start:176 stop:580 length:405 start_codon:yes stop_codon:yes gene_type:complete
MEILQLKLALAEKEVENIRLQISLHKQLEKNNQESNHLNTYQIEDEFEIFDTIICNGDDRLVFPASTSLLEVKEKCIEIGSHAFVTKPGCQIYVRSPPSEKSNRDYITMKNNAKKRVLEKPLNLKGYKTYLFNY